MHIFSENPSFVAFTYAAYLNHESHKHTINVNFDYKAYFSEGSDVDNKIYTISTAKHLRNLSKLVAIGTFTKEYTFIVRDTDNTFNNEYKFETDESSLGKDLDNRGIIETDDSGTTRFVTAVDGKKADSSKQEWWNLKVNGENSVTGVDDTIINNGDKIEFVLTTGW